MSPINISLAASKLYAALVTQLHIITDQMAALAVVALAVLR
jgi:hypothetical protein